MKKIKILTISDNPAPNATSGNGIQMMHVCKALLDSGKFSIVSVAGAIEHRDYSPFQIPEYGNDWTVIPIKGMGDPQLLRSMIWSQKPDSILLCQDPRFFEWFFQIENEINSVVPSVYWNLWDNYPVPRFNAKKYNSVSALVTISQLSNKLVKETVPRHPEIHHIPHVLDYDVFKPLPEEEVEKFRKYHFGEEKKLLLFWNNRNARRKQSGSLLFWYKEWLDAVGHDSAILLMHTNPKDANGPDLEEIVTDLGLDSGQVIFSPGKLDFNKMAMLYNVADCTINIAHSEGFGLSSMESLACGTPIIINMTGGLQEQVTDGANWFGVGLQPAVKSIVGSQQVPYIYEDYVSKEDFVAALSKMYHVGPEQRKQWGKAGREYLLSNYGKENFQKRWVETMTDLYERYGSWENRKGYKAWEIRKIS